jgi:hypothetical protein
MGAAKALASSDGGTTREYGAEDGARWLRSNVGRSADALG